MRYSTFVTSYSAKIVQVSVVVSQHPSFLDNRQLDSIVDVFLYTARKAFQLTCILIRHQCGTVKATHILSRKFIHEWSLYQVKSLNLICTSCI